ncbi:hypothetical protein Q8F55_009309 [Vanrija albida]|uniref:Uncharacterized protein n=1 Tax=Vanrija albida TaxID=181172 RepID=A0ABR3PT96_9TREE
MRWLKRLRSKPERSTPAPSSSPPPSPTCLDASAFPTIVDTITSFLIDGLYDDPAAAPRLHALRLVSRSLKNTVDAKLARHIRIEFVSEVVYDAEHLAEVNALQSEPGLLLPGEEAPEFGRNRKGHERRAISAIHRATSITSAATQRIPGLHWGYGASAPDMAECLRRLRDTEDVETTGYGGVDSPADDLVTPPPLLRDRVLLNALLSNAPVAHEDSVHSGLVPCRWSRPRTKSICIEAVHAVTY